MRQRKGFTLIELLVVISIIALLIGILLPALGAARQTARMMQSNTHLRGIHQGMVIFAQANKTGTNDGQYPGFNPSGGVLTVAQVNERVSELGGFTDADNEVYHGGTVGARFGLLLDQNLFSPDYAINPLETNSAVVAYDPNDGINFDNLDASADPDNDRFNYSYAMLAASQDPGIAAALTGNGGGRAFSRAIEWSETLNTNALVIGDRNLGNPAGGGANHSHVTRDSSGQWRGGLGWNDNHVGTENTTHHDTRYAFEDTDADNVFVDETGGDDACLTHPEGEDSCDIS